MSVVKTAGSLGACCVLLLSTCGCGGRSDHGQDAAKAKPADSYQADSSRPTGSYEADNTGRNAGDAPATATPFDQGNNEADLGTTQKIRQAVMDEASLSTTAKNVKIITKDGKVMLRGPVNASNEKTRIEEIAIRIAGAGNVMNEIELVAPQG
jgi:hypothetical protein